MFQHSLKTAQEFQTFGATSDPPAADAMGAIAVVIHRRRGEEVYASDRPEDYWFRVVSGAARSYVLLPGGRRRILDLLLPDDSFTFTPCGGHHYGLDAVVDHTVVACYPSDKLQKLADSNAAVRHELSQMTVDAIARLQELVLVLGRTRARQKVGAFLLWIAQRTSGKKADRILLATSRYDIADYLALSVETVSRSLSDLKHLGCIALAGPRRVQIINRRQLDEENAVDDDDY